MKTTFKQKTMLWKASKLVQKPQRIRASWN